MAGPTLKRKRARPTPPPQVRTGLRASAQRFPLQDRKLTHKQSVPRREWQNEAWEHFDDVPELKYSIWFEGNVMAKCRFFVAVRDPADPEATPIPATDPEANLPAGAAARAQAELDRLRAPLGGRAEIIRALNMNLEVTAEGYVIGWGPREVDVKDPVSGQVVGSEITSEEWGIYSVSQVEEKDGTYTVKEKPGDPKPRKVDPQLDTIIRIFQRHPRWSLEADCNMRGVLGDCEALVLLSNSIKAGAKSRMSAGWLLIPSELSTGPDEETDPEDGEEAAVDPMLQDIYDGAVEPIEDPSSAAAVAPVMIRGPSDALKEFRLVERMRLEDPQVLAKITAEIERLARGMNLPVEVVMGHQQTTFANAMQVKQDTFDDHFQPRCVLICDGLTVGFLQPNLIDAGMDPAVAERIVVWYDPSGMIKQVNPVDSADQGVTLGIISDEAWRRAWGWSEDDAPDPEERLIRAVLHLRTFDKGLSTAILELLGVPLDIPEALPGSTTGGTTAGATPATPAAAAAMERALAAAIATRYPHATEDGRAFTAKLLADTLDRRPELAEPLTAAAAALPTAKVRANPGYDLMLLDRDLRSKLLVAADVAMTRALEKAGNKLRAKAPKERTLARAAQVHSVYVAATLGPHIVAAAGFSDDDLISADAWNGLEAQWRTWVAGAQQRALTIAGKVVTLSAAQRTVLAQGQASAADAGWRWMKDELHALAVKRLYAPDPVAPAAGEHDPTCKVPVGLVRQALARAGGASSIAPLGRVKPELRASSPESANYPGADAAGTPVFVALNNDAPLGGIGTGEDISGALVDGGAGTDGYQWEYGPAYRAHPFEPHESLDGVPFVNFDDDVLAAGDWIGDYYFPGDHDGCVCDVTPIWIDPGELAASNDTQTAGGADTAALDQAAADERATPLTAEDRITAAITTPSNFSNFPGVIAQTGTVDLGTMPDEIKTLVADRISAFAAEYPDAALSITSVQTSDLSGVFGIDEAQSTFAAVGQDDFGQPSRALYLNSDWFGNPDAFTRALELSQQTNVYAFTNADGVVSDLLAQFHPEGNIGSVIDHEMGHVLDRRYELSSAAHRISTAVTSPADVAKIGAYAGTNERELFAEMFAIRQAEGAAGIAARSEDLGAVWQHVFTQAGITASAAGGGEDGVTCTKPWVPPDVVETMKREGSWPFPAGGAR